MQHVYMQKVCQNANTSMYRLQLAQTVEDSTRHHLLKLLAEEEARLAWPRRKEPNFSFSRRNTLPADRPSKADGPAKAFDPHVPNDIALRVASAR
jgi:hypothetical protein